jgi:hypothetical protein
MERDFVEEAVIEPFFDFKFKLGSTLRGRVLGYRELLVLPDGLARDTIFPTPDWAAINNGCGDRAFFANTTTLTDPYFIQYVIQD